jgi:hypothetical protein
VSDDLRAAIRMDAARLDAARPGWAAEIDRGRLDVNDCDDCIYGQLFGNYLKLVRAVLRLEPGLADRIRAACHPRLVDVEMCRVLWLAEVAARTGEVA